MCDRDHDKIRNYVQFSNRRLNYKIPKNKIQYLFSDRIEFQLNFSSTIFGHVKNDFNSLTILHMRFLFLRRIKIFFSINGICKERQEKLDER